jgi:hypothetical protein
MEKLVYILWKRDGLSDVGFREEMLGPVAARLLELGTHRLAINLVDELVREATAVRLTTIDPPMAGMVSFWLDVADDRTAHEEALATATARRAGYLVVESVPKINTTHTAPLGQRTPGINMVACIEKPSRLTYEAWRERWHVEHRAVAVETQSIYAYVRNVVVRSLTPGAPPWLGIVEEGFPTEAVTDPMLWYRSEGSTEKMRRNLARMMESVQSFLDVDRVESHPMSEYRLGA